MPKIKNTSGVTIPGRSFVRVGGAAVFEQGDWYLPVAKPNADSEAGEGAIYVTGPREIPAGQRGFASGPENEVWVKYDESEEPDANGTEEWGPVDDEWIVGGDGCGWVVIGKKPELKIALLRWMGASCGGGEGGGGGSGNSDSSDCLCGEALNQSAGFDSGCEAVLEGWRSAQVFVATAPHFANPGLEELSGAVIEFDHDEGCKWVSQEFTLKCRPESPGGSSSTTSATTGTTGTSAEEDYDEGQYRFEITLEAATEAGVSVQPQARMELVHVGGEDCVYEFTATSRYFVPNAGGMFRVQDANCIEWRGCFCVRAGAWEGMGGSGPCCEASQNPELVASGDMRDGYPDTYVAELPISFVPFGVKAYDGLTHDTVWVGQTTLGCTNPHFQKSCWTVNPSYEGPPALSWTSNATEDGLGTLEMRLDRGSMSVNYGVNYPPLPSGGSHQFRVGFSFSGTYSPISIHALWHIIASASYTGTVHSDDFDSEGGWELHLESVFYANDLWTAPVLGNVGTVPTWITPVQFPETIRMYAGHLYTGTNGGRKNPCRGQIDPPETSSTSGTSGSSTTSTSEEEPDQLVYCCGDPSLIPPCWQAAAFDHDESASMLVLYCQSVGGTSTVIPYPEGEIVPCEEFCGEMTTSSTTSTTGTSGSSSSSTTTSEEEPPPSSSTSTTSTTATSGSSSTTTSEEESTGACCVCDGGFSICAGVMTAEECWEEADLVLGCVHWNEGSSCGATDCSFLDDCCGATNCGGGHSGEHIYICDEPEPGFPFWTLFQSAGTCEPPPVNTIPPEWPCEESVAWNCNQCQWTHPT